MSARYRPAVSLGPRKLHIAAGRDGRALCGFEGHHVGRVNFDIVSASVCKRCQKIDASSEPPQEHLPKGEPGGGGES